MTDPPLAWMSSADLQAAPWFHTDSCLLHPSRPKLHTGRPVQAIPDQAYFPQSFATCHSVTRRTLLSSSSPLASPRVHPPHLGSSHHKHVSILPARLVHRTLATNYCLARVRTYPCKPSLLLHEVSPTCMAPANANLQVGSSCRHPCPQTKQLPSFLPRKITSRRDHLVDQSPPAQCLCRPSYCSPQAPPSMPVHHHGPLFFSPREHTATSSHPQADPCSLAPCMATYTPRPIPGFSPPCLSNHEPHPMTTYKPSCSLACLCQASLADFFPPLAV